MKHWLSPLLIFLLVLMLTITRIGTGPSWLVALWGAVTGVAFVHLANSWWEGRK